MLDTDKSYIRRRLTKLCRWMDYLNEDLRVAIEVDSSNEFTLLTLDSVEKDIQRAFKELRDAKEVYYANP
jgi:hypothetical protein